MRNDTQVVADFVCLRLKHFGVHILRYDSPAYGSVYLKFDYGAGGSLRIADHQSLKTHLNYKYNLITDGEVPRPIKTNFEMRFYTVDQTDVMVEDIIRNIRGKKQYFGEEAYEQYMNKNKVQEQGKGFWQKAREVS